MENKSESAGDEAHDEKEHSRGCPTVSKGEKKVLLQEYSMHRERERECTDKKKFSVSKYKDPKQYIFSKYQVTVT